MQVRPAPHRKWPVYQFTTYYYFRVKRRVGGGRGEAREDGDGGPAKLRLISQVVSSSHYSAFLINIVHDLPNLPTNESEQHCRLD